jgi:NAD(P)H-dependent flavin oxidoreductase YrpB (nitropropane dioxygenase family)
MQLPPLKVGQYTANIPLIQGGMSVRVSTAPLAAAVAREGGIGVIGGSGLPANELHEEIIAAKKKANGGIIAVNIMFVAAEFTELVETSIDAGVDIIITGAGFSRDIYKVGREHNTPIVSIVSSAKFAKLAQKMGAAAIIVEGTEAGGHLGTDRPTKEITSEVLAAVGQDIPVIAAGGVTNGYEWAEYLKMGCAGVQIATRFVLSEECEVADSFKQAILDAGKDDILVFQSPVGLPGRAARTPYLDRVLNNDTGKTICHYQCMKSCKHEFCILDSLKNSQAGDTEHGIVFSGAMAYKFKDILPVKTIINQLVKEAESVE